MFSLHLCFFFTRARLVKDTDQVRSVIDYSAAIIRVLYQCRSKDQINREGSNDAVVTGAGGGGALKKGLRKLNCGRRGRECDLGSIKKVVDGAAALVFMLL